MFFGILDYRESGFKNTLILATASCCAVLLSASNHQNGGAGIRELRREVIEAGMQGEEGLRRLSALVDHDNVLIRRAVAGSLANSGPDALPLLMERLSVDEDVLVKRSAMRSALSIILENPLPILAIAIQDENPVLRMAAVETLIGLGADDDEAIDLLRTVANDPDDGVRGVVSSALWPYNKRVESLREHHTFMDLYLHVIYQVDLSPLEWRFALDPDYSGQDKKWMSPKLDDSDWQSIRIGCSWQDQGFKYNGAAWYRAYFNLPEKMDQQGTDLVFEGVDQEAWVWVNGKFVGAHAIGEDGWNRQFGINVGDYLKWGGANQITVRVVKTEGGHAGIWRPVHLDVLSLRRSQ